MTERPATIAITMAGFGSRFRDAGYDLPKYMIEAHGRTLFEWSLAGLDCFIATGSPFIFIVRGEDRAEDFIDDRARALGIAAPSIIAIDAPTDGQATTALIASITADPVAPFAIFNIDTGLKPSLIRPSEARGTGWIPCFDAPGDAWSFVRLDEEGRAAEVREKRRISSHATIGFYWFSSARLYRHAYETYYAVPGREEHRERYVAPIYNQLISEGHPVYITTVPYEAVTALGTPRDVAAFDPAHAARMGAE